MRLSIMAIAICLSVVGLAAADNAPAQTVQGNYPSAVGNPSSISPASSDSSSSGLTEIIVTAQKRAERLIDVPISVVALSGDELQERQLTSLDDLQIAVPGMSIQQNGS